MLSPSSAPAITDAQHAFAGLQRISPKTTGELRSAELEIALIRAIRREPTSRIGEYQVYMDTTREDRTTVFVHNPMGDEHHKYIIAHANSHTFIIATPMGWTQYHKNILARVMVATSLTVFCSGGGIVAVDSEGKLVVDGASVDFGAGDHALAKAALSTAVKNSRDTRTD